MYNIRLKLEYDGSSFHGWQSQPDVRTIQETLHDTLEIVLRQPVKRLTASGRTDSGVHARAQIANFLVEELPALDTLTHSISSILKGQVAVLEAKLVPESFDARRDALRKQYSYSILHRNAAPVLGVGRVWHVTSALDYQLMNRQAKELIGTLDFTSFRGAGCSARSPIRTVYESGFEQKDGLLIYRVVGDGFLKQMVRNIVGTLVGLGKGNLGETTVTEILAQKDRRCAGVTAPPQGLYLDWVEYPPELQ